MLSNMMGLHMWYKFILQLLLEHHIANSVEPDQNMHNHLHTVASRPGGPEALSVLSAVLCIYITINLAKQHWVRFVNN